MLIFLDSGLIYGPLSTAPERAAAALLIPRKWTNGSATMNSDGSMSQFALRRTLPTTFTSWAASWQLQLDPGGSDYGRGDLIIWGAVSTQFQLRSLVTLELMPDGRLVVLAGSNIRDASTDPIPTGVLNTLEMNIQMGVDGTTHEISVNAYVRVNGFQVIVTGFSPTGIFTTAQVSGDAAITSVKFAGSTVGFSTIKNPVIYNNATDAGAHYNITSAQGGGGPVFWLGEVNLGAVFPDGDVVTDWASTGAASWDQINSLPPDPAKFISSSNVGDKDAFTWQNVDAFPILSILYSAYMAKNDAGTRAVSLRSGATSAEVILGDTALSASPYWISRGRDSDPASGLQWTQATFNAKDFGVALVE